MRPFVICHTMSSVDGRIQSSRWGIANAPRFFEEPAARIKVDAWIVGRTTFQEFASQKPRKKRKGTFRIPKTDFVGKHDAKTYAVGIDPSGKCNWHTNMTDTEHVVEVLTEKVSGEYLDHLRGAGVSYIFAGASEIDLHVALRKLRKLFGIKRARIDGGGTVNGSFLKAGLIDELSHVIVPVADGSMNTPTMFDVEPGHTRRMARQLTLKSIKRLNDNTLWLRYLATPHKP
jgi:2,5-diamino-6-(ribosylamino)-4(3H)-pyrimidinone 5'-phosphate reductase